RGSRTSSGPLPRLIPTLHQENGDDGSLILHSWPTPLLSRSWAPVCRSRRRLTMPARLKFLPVRPAALECFAQAPRNFAGGPEGDGCVLRSVERRSAEGRDVLQRGVLRAVAALDASLPSADAHAVAGRAAPADLSLRRGWFGAGRSRRRA